MLKELYTAAMGMLPQQTRLEVITNNMANANTPGFKRESVFERNLIDARAIFNNVPGEAEQDDPPVGSYTDFSAGNFQQTDNPLDLVVENPKGFFLVQDEAGNQYLTKGGHFKIGSDGTIATMDGKILMGTDGPINVSKEYAANVQNLQDSTSLEIKIDEHGAVTVNNMEVGEVQIVNVGNLNSLEQVSNSNFIVTDNSSTGVMPEEDVKVRQGWLEGSNVNIIREMVSMIELQRMYEAGTKVIQINDGTLDKSMSLGKYF